jgi:2-polyprenyl-3-methyl-5-hydroxy-6-metoxy-1,4-benzoquinol methylase
MSDSELAEIRAIIADLQKTLAQQRAAQGKTDMPQMPDPLAGVLKHQRVNSHWHIGWPAMPPGILPKLTAYAQKIIRRLLRWYINPLVDQQNAYNAAATKLLIELYNQNQECLWRIQGLQDKLERLQNRLDGLQDNLGGLKNTLQELQQTRDAWLRDLQGQTQYVKQIQQDHEFKHAEVDLRLQRLERWRREGSAPPPPLPALTNNAPGVDYFLLGAMYRNDKQMAAGLADYDEFFVSLAQAQQQGQTPGAVLDVGCGRGDLVAHLAELGLTAYGIDIDADAVQMAQSAGRDVRLADVFVHLSQLPDASLAAITFMQVIEHFDIETLLRMLKLAAQKLAPGGFILAETINPVCLWAASNWYLLDPSHRVPLHPQMTRFLLHQAGLSNVQIRLMHPVAEGARLKKLPMLDPLPALQPWSDTLNSNIDQLNNFLYGAQDYAAIGYKAVE